MKENKKKKYFIRVYASINNIFLIKLKINEK
jgi:hypothetical protein